LRNMAYLPRERRSLSFLVYDVGEFIKDWEWKLG